VGAIVAVERHLTVAEEGRMALQTRHVGTRLLLILALAAALLAGIVAVGWVMGQAHVFGIGSQPHYIAPGGGFGGGH
jgi:hypothetical protein